jgi:hypothetical protein
MESGICPRAGFPRSTSHAHVPGWNARQIAIASHHNGAFAHIRAPKRIILRLFVRRRHLVPGKNCCLQDRSNPLGKYVARQKIRRSGCKPDAELRIHAGISCTILQAVAGALLRYATLAMFALPRVAQRRGKFGQHVARPRNGIPLQGNTPSLHRIRLRPPNRTPYPCAAPYASKALSKSGFSALACLSKHRAAST